MAVLSMELVKNPDFEMEKLEGWTLVTAGGGRGQLSREATPQAGLTNAHSLRLTVTDPGRRCGICNPGNSGIEVRAEEWFDLSFQARTEPRENNRGYGLTVSIESDDGNQVGARTTLPEVGGDWKDYTVALHARTSLTRARLVITMSEAGEIWLDKFSLVRRPISQQSKSP